MPKEIKKLFEKVLKPPSALLLPPLIKGGIKGGFG
jgi:hypothetical protein